MAQNLEQKIPQFSLKLNFAAVAIDKQNNAQFAKIGNLKIILFSQNQAFNIETQTETNFQNIVEGTLNPGDKLLVSTEYLFNVLEQWNIIEKIAYFKKPKELKSFLKQQKNDLRQLSGCCILVFIPLRSKGLSRLLPKIKMNKRTQKVIIASLLLIIILTIGYYIF